MIQKKIVALIPSNSLKEYISENNIEFLPYVLMQLADEYANSYDERIALLKELTNIADEKTNEVLPYLIESRMQELEQFLKPEENTVFELRIQLNYNFYNEQYFCKTFESAVKTVKAFLKEYECEDELNNKSTITIKKWSIFDEKIDFENDILGELELNENLEIKNAVYWRFDECFQYQREMFDFSAFYRGYHPVKYYDYNGKPRFSIIVPISNINCETEEEYPITDEVYALPIDEAIDLTEEGAPFCYHEHIPVTEIEILDKAELNNFMLKNYNDIYNYCRNIL